MQKGLSESLVSKWDLPLHHPYWPFLAKWELSDLLVGHIHHGNVAHMAEEGDIGKGSVCTGFLCLRPIFMLGEMLPISLHPSRVVELVGYIRVKIQMQALTRANNPDGHLTLRIA